MGERQNRRPQSRQADASGLVVTFVRLVKEFDPKATSWKEPLGRFLRAWDALEKRRAGEGDR